MLNKLLGIIKHLYCRYTICKRYGHLWLPIQGAPDCERIYTSGVLDQDSRCLLCGKIVNVLEFDMVATKTSRAVNVK